MDGGVAGKQFAVGADFVGFRIDLHVGQGIVEFQVTLAEGAEIGDENRAFVQVELGGNAIGDRCLTTDDGWDFGILGCAPVLRDRPSMPSNINADGAFT